MFMYVDDVIFTIREIYLNRRHFWNRIEFSERKVLSRQQISLKIVCTIEMRIFSKSIWFIIELKVEITISDVEWQITNNSNRTDSILSRNSTTFKNKRLKNSAIAEIRTQGQTATQRTPYL